MRAVVGIILGAIGGVVLAYVGWGAISFVLILLFGTFGWIGPEAELQIPWAVEVPIAVLTLAWWILCVVVGARAGKRLLISPSRASL